MEEIEIPNTRRGTQILSALHEHGPLSNRGLRGVISPTITKDGVKQAMRILLEKRLVVKRFDSLPHNAPNFFQISLTANTRPIIAKMLDKHPLSLETPRTRDHELLHSEECAIWCARLRLLFPEANVLREFHYMHLDDFKRPLLMRNETWKLKPDIMMRFKNDDEKRSTTIAVEVERSCKSVSRIMEKLDKFSSKTVVDGVIYFCSNDSIMEAVRRIYDEKYRRNALRIAHYGNNFVLFGNGKWDWETAGLLMYNTELKTVSLANWIKFLTETIRELRRIKNLKMGPDSESCSEEEKYLRFLRK